MERSARGRERKGRGQGPGGLIRAGPPLGGPVRSISLESGRTTFFPVLLGSGPTDLHYGENGYVPVCLLLRSTLPSLAANVEGPGPQCE